MTKPRTPRVGRPFIALHTNTLLDAKLKMAGNVARLVHTDLLLLAAATGCEGTVSKNARELQVSLQLDGGLPELNEAIAALVEAGKLTDHGDKWLLNDWALTQADLGGSAARSASAGPAQLKRYHEAGKHVDAPRENCELCANGTPAPAPMVATPAEKAAPAPVEDAPMTTKTLEREFRAVFEPLFASMPRLDAYRALLAQADELGTAHADLSANVRGTLMNAVLGDALTHYLGDAVQGKTFAACYRGAKALSERDGHYFWILAAQASATVEFENPKHAVSWLTTVASNKRAEWLGGAA